MAQQVLFLRIAGALGALAVILGAFGAHGLRERLAPEMLAVFEVGVRYQMYHALALLAISLAPISLWNSPATVAAAWSWVAGVLVFSGSLYALALSGIKWLGAITPIGGVAFILGWAALIVGSGRLLKS